MTNIITSEDKIKFFNEKLRNKFINFKSYSFSVSISKEVINILFLALKIEQRTDVHRYGQLPYRLHVYDISDNMKREHYMSEQMLYDLCDSNKYPYYGKLDSVLHVNGADKNGVEYIIVA